MIKKLTLLILMSSLLLSCENNNSNNITNNENNNLEEVTIIEESVVEENPFEFDVSNTSNNFSNDDLIYFIMIDRFNNGDNTNDDFDDTDIEKSESKYYQGGDLQGIIDKLDYIKSAGATTIWLTPIFKNEPFGYHGYWIEDFFEIDPHFGDMDTFKKLVEEAHKKDIKVILDYVVNHTGYNHPWVTDDSKYDYFHHNNNITNFRDENQVLNYSLAGLPDLNQDNPEVKSYFFDNALYWIRETNIDGFRLDTVRHVEQEFWNEFAYILKQEFPDFFLLGEVWVNSPSLLEEYHQLGIDSITNFPLYEGIKKTFTLYGKASDLKIAINNDSKFSNPEINGIFIDNHDTPRLISNTSKFNTEYLKLSLSFIMTYPSIPVIYYGTEIGLEGKEDPDNRKFMIWEDLNTKEIEMNDYYNELVDLRYKINNIDFDTFTILDSNSNYIVYEQTNKEKSLIMFLNVSDKNVEITLDNLTNTGIYYDYLNKSDLTVNNNDVFKLEPFSNLILIKEK